MPAQQPIPRVPRLAAILAFAAVAGCGGSSSDEQLANFCGETEYRDPLLAITSVVNAETRTQLPEVLISGFSVDESPTTPAAIYPGKNTASVDGGLRCTVPCGFGIVPGRYGFSVSAVGYKAKVVSTPATFKTKLEGCVTQFSGSTEVSLELTPL
jgi:hypothetical protein